MNRATVWVMVVFGGGVVLAVLFVWNEARHLAEEAARREAEHVATSLLSFRKLYTEEVVARAADAGVTATHDFRSRPGTIPLPATLSMELGAALGQATGMRVSLHSPYPFPWRRSERDDPAQIQVWERLARDPQDPVVSLEDLEGSPVLRYARADVMHDACVSCHNTHPDTPKADWKVGDVRGVVEVVVPVKAGILASPPLRRMIGMLGLFGLLGLVGVRAFATNQKRLNDQVRRVEQRTRANMNAIVDAVVEGIVVIDRAGIIQSVNPGAQKLFGFSVDELLGQNVRLLMPEPYRGEHDGYLANYHATGRAKVIGIGREVQGQRKDGSVFPLELAVGLIAAPGEGYVGVLRDITERKASEQALVEARDKAVRAARAKAEFLATMSHEIRTPMNAVIGMAGLLLRADLSDKQKRRARILSAAADRLLALINDILDFSKIEEGKLELAPHTFNALELFETLAQTLAFSAQEKNIELILRVDPALPDHLVGDAGRLQQVLVNLVGNAIKFTLEGYVIISVRPQPSSEPTTNVEISVQDTGIGIPEDKQKTIFQAFTQADATTTRKFGGSGLGLTITRRLIELMGGSINLRSREGEGTTFTVVVPLPASREQASRGVDTSSLAGMRVLIVDDMEPNRAMLSEWLESWGTVAEDCSDGQRAMEKIRLAHRAGNPYEAVVVDYFMPGMDGVTLAQKIRADSALQDLTLILSSSAGDASLPPDAAKLFDAFAPKPIRIEELRLALGRARGIDADAAIEATDPIGAFPGLRVLVVDDVPTNLEVCRDLLETMSCEVRTASDGVEAIALSEQFEHDVILMDCNMPRLDGYQATQRIRAREGEEGSRVPIIAVTAGVLAEEHERTSRAGMDDFLSKPIIASDLSRMLAKHCPDKRIQTDGLAAAPRVDVAELKQVFEQRFKAAAHRLIAELRERIQETDQEQTIRAAHSLRGSIGTLATERIKSLTLEIEASAKDMNWNKVRELFVELNGCLS